MNLIWLRVLLALVPLAGAIYIAVGVFMNPGLNAAQASMLNTIALGLIFISKSAAAWAYDGIAGKDEPAAAPPADGSTTTAAPKEPA